MWGTLKKDEPSAKRRRMEEETEDMPLLPLMLPKMASSSIYSHNHKVFFNDDITDQSCFMLNKELRTVAERMKMIGLMHDHPPAPIVLHLTTNGGQIYAAFSVIDCIQQLGVPVHTVIDGFVASAGTLISIVGAQRFILPNAYMLVHELRSEFWGKMTDIEVEIENLQKTMNHVKQLYLQHTSLKSGQLDKILKKDAIWNAEECLQKGLVDEVLM